MKRVQLVSQGSLQRMLQEATEAWGRRDFQQHFELLERASRLNPANPQILFQLGTSYGRRYDYAEAERYFEKALRLAPRKAEALAMVARSFVNFARPQLAERYFQQALELPEATPDTAARLAELYELLHRAEDAAAMVDRALHRDNTCALARITQAKLHRQAGKLKEAEEVLRPVLTTDDRELRIRGYYELGTIYDRQGRYDDAMSVFQQGKTLFQPDVPPLLVQLESIIKHLNEMRDNLSSEMLVRWSDSSRELLQPARRMALLAGHARSGTTLLEQVLDAHPDIISADETHIFTDDTYCTLRNDLPPKTSMLAGLDGASVETLRRARERYFQSMSSWLGHPPGEHLLIDKNPSLQALIITFIRVFPEARLIVALRDPRDVVLSCFTMLHYPLSVVSASFVSLEGAVKTYTRAMGIWQKLKPLLKNPWLEVRYEDVVQDLEPVARQTLDFLGVPWDSRVLGFDEHARQKMVLSPTYSDVAQPVYKRARGRWLHYQKYLEPHLKALEPFVKAFGYE